MTKPPSLAKPKPGVALGGSRISVGGGPSGTLGCLATLDGDVVILGSAHVLAMRGVSDPGAPIYLQGKSEAIARLKSSVAIDFGGSGTNQVDAAIAKIVDAKAVSPWIGDWGPPHGASPQITVGMRVWCWGGQSGGKTSIVNGTNWSGQLEYPNGDRANFAGLISCAPLYAQEGDSGAVVLNDDMQVVGLHVAGLDAEGVSLFCPITPVLQAWPGLEIFGVQD
jgi:hypothetical protein